MSGLPGGYVEQAGNVGGNRIIQVCRDSSRGLPLNILVWGVDLYLLADFLSMEWNALCVHPDRHILEKTRAELGQLLFDDDLVRRRLRIVARPMEEGICDLVKDKHISTVVLLGVLHHTPQPSAVLSQLLRGGEAVVVLDTTTELMNQAILEDGSSNPGVFTTYLSCRDAVACVGFNGTADIQAVLEKSCIQEPQIFECPVICDWCRGKEMCTHSGVYSWLAGWEGA